MKQNRKFLALGMALVFLLVLAAPALAASNQYYATTGLNVRSGPSTRYSIVGGLNKNQVVTVLSQSGNWYRISYGGGTGYASASYLRPYSGGSTGGGTVATGTVYAVSSVNVRSGPGTGYTIVGELARGQAVTKVGTYGNWTMINYGSGVCYVSSSYLSSTNPSGGSSSGGTADGYALMAATANVNVRYGPGTNYSIVGNLYAGQTIYRTGAYSGNWTQVIYNNQYAYVSSSYLRLSSGGSSGGGYDPVITTMYTLHDTTVRGSASSSGTVWGYLTAGQRVNVLGSRGSYYLIEYGSRQGYVLQSHLSGSKPSTASGTIYAVVTTQVRTGPGNGYASLGYMRQGDSAVRIGTYGNWTQIRFNGNVGYVLTSDMSTGYYPSGGFTSTSRTMYSNQNYNYAYSSPSTSSTVMGYFRKGERVYVTGYSSSWAQVYESGKTMYMPLSTLSYSSYDYDAEWSRTVIVTNRRGADAYTSFSGYTSAGNIPYGTILTQVGTDRNRAQVVWYNKQSSSKTVFISESDIRVYD